MKLKIITLLGIITAVFCGAFFSLQTNTVSGSVVQGGEYKATTTSTMGASKHQVIGLINTSPAIAQSSTTLQTLGSVIVASSSAASMTIWNATSTTDVSSTTIAVFKASVGEGTYTFDVALTRGLIIALPAGSNGAYTITYR